MDKIKTVTELKANARKEALIAIQKIREAKKIIMPWQRKLDMNRHIDNLKFWQRQFRWAITWLKANKPEVTQVEKVACKLVANGFVLVESNVLYCRSGNFGDKYVKGSTVIYLNFHSAAGFI